MRETLNHIAKIAGTTGTPEGDRAIMQRIAQLARRALEQAACPKCQDRPGFDGLGHVCRACKGTGFRA